MAEKGKNGRHGLLERTALPAAKRTEPRILNLEAALAAKLVVANHDSQA